jgi:hypothetical protein
MLKLSNLTAAAVIGTSLVAGPAFVTNGHASADQTIQASAAYKYPGVMNAVLQGRLATLRWGTDRDAALVAGHFVGLTVWTNSRCNFLPQNVAPVAQQIYDGLRARSYPHPLASLITEGAVNGVADAKTLLEQFGCRSTEARRVQATLAEVGAELARAMPK